MHAWLAFISGILVAMAGLLIYAAVSGITYYGLGLEMETALAATLLVIAAITGWLFYAGYKAQYKRVKTGKEALIGSKGVAVTDIKPKGEVRVMGEFWQALTKDGVIANGETVEVLGMEGMFLVVKASKDKT